MATISDRTGVIAPSPDSTEVVATTDKNDDGDRRDDRIAAEQTGAVATTDATGRASVDTGTAAPQRLAERTAAAKRAAAVSDAAVVDADQTVVEPVEPMVARGPRARASLMATMSLILGVAAALSVLTGVLAGPGVAVGLLAAIAGLGGVAATSRRHVAGKSDAFLGLGLGLAAIVFGVLALTGNLSWLDGDTNQVMRVHDWIAANASWLLP